MRGVGDNFFKFKVNIYPSGNPDWTEGVSAALRPSLYLSVLTTTSPPDVYMYSHFAPFYMYHMTQLHFIFDSIPNKNVMPPFKKLVSDGRADEVIPVVLPACSPARPRACIQCLC